MIEGRALCSCQSGLHISRNFEIVGKSTFELKNSDQPDKNPTGQQSCIFQEIKSSDSSRNPVASFRTFTLFVPGLFEFGYIGEHLRRTAADQEQNKKNWKTSECQALSVSPNDMWPCAMFFLGIVTWAPFL